MDLDAHVMRLTKLANRLEPFLPMLEELAKQYDAHQAEQAVALANLDVFEGEHILQHVQSTEAAFRSALDDLLDLPIVGNVRGAGFFYGIELVKDKETRLSFDDDGGSIGRRYRRQDEIGTPYAFTIDDQTLEDDTVTVRERDSLAQQRLPLSAVKDWLEAALERPWTTPKTA